MIAILTIIGIVSYSSVNKRSRDVKRKSDLEQIRSALEMFRSDNGEYPGQTSYPGITDSLFNNASTLGPALVGNQYIPAIPSDPNGNSSYYYEVIPTNAVHGSYCVCACLESNNCDGTIPANIVSDTCSNIASHIANCNYYLKSP